MKRWLVVVVLVMIAASVVAAAPKYSRGRAHRPMMWLEKEEKLLQEQLDAALAARGSQALGDLTVAEAKELLDEISVAYQKAAYVAKSRAMSLMLPGLGQFMNDDPGMGALFLGADIVVGVGTLLGAYFLLPGEVQFDQLNYFTDSFDEIETAWKGRSFVDFLPTLGVLAGGGLVQAVLRGVSSKHAARLAEKNIAEGAVTFEPKAYLLPLGPAAMGFGMGMKY
jgi:TM2 domain-containing membrane protein YozV